MLSPFRFTYWVDPQRLGDCRSKAVSPWYPGLTTESRGTATPWNVSLLPECPALYPEQFLNLDQRLDTHRSHQ